MRGGAQDVLRDPAVSARLRSLAWPAHAFVKDELLTAHDIVDLLIEVAQVSGDGLAVSRPFRMSLWCAEHGQRAHVDGSGQQTIKLREQRLEMGHGEVGIQSGAAGPVFVENKDAGVGGIDMEIIVYAAGFGAGGGDLRHQQCGQFFAGFGSGGDGADYRVHVRPFSG